MSDLKISSINATSNNIPIKAEEKEQTVEQPKKRWKLKQKFLLDLEL
jgi:hypothetical protein